MAENIAVQEPQLPLLPTTVIGSYAYPSWLWTALEEMRQGKYGESDIDETLGDAGQNGDPRSGGSRDRHRQRRRNAALVRLSKLVPTTVRTRNRSNRCAKLAFTATTAWLAIVPWGAWQRRAGWALSMNICISSRIQKPIKVTCTGPVTMTMPIELGAIYKDRIELAAEVAHVINAELKALGAAGAKLYTDRRTFLCAVARFDE